MQKAIMDGYADLANPIYSPQYNTHRARTTSVQMTVHAKDGAPADAYAEVQVSNNATEWFTSATLETKGTGLQFDGGPYEALWNYTRIKLTKSPEKVDGKGIVEINVIFRE